MFNKDLHSFQTQVFSFILYLTSSKLILFILNNLLNYHLSASPFKLNLLKKSLAYDALFLAAPFKKLL